MTEAQLALRAEIFRSFAATGAPPELPDSPDLRALVERHVVVLDGDGRIVMAHPFAGHTGEPPALEPSPELRSLAEQRIVVLEAEYSAHIWMAHPFAGHHGGTRVKSGDRTWWGNCAWDGFGIVHALALPEATVTAQGVAVRISGGVPDEAGGAVFDVAVPAARWWDDIAHT